MKRVLRWLLAICLCLSCISAAFAMEYGIENNPGGRTYSQTFYDVPANHWAFSYIAELVERGAINGYPDGNFYPNETVSRSQFAKIMVAAAGLTAVPASRSSFADVPLTHWASPFAETAKPYMTAYRNGAGQLLFKPNEAAQREDIAVAVVRLKGYDTRLADVSLLDVMFRDADSISEAAKPYVALAIENGIISGYPGTNGEKGTFGGQRTITRGEAAAMLWRAFQSGDDNKVIAGEESGTEATPENGQDSGGGMAPAAKYGVETVEELPTRMDDCVMTKSGAVYYLQNNRLYCVTGGNTEQIFDGNTDYYEEMTAGEFLEELYNGPEENYWGGMESVGFDGSQLLYFDTLTLTQLAYDQVNDRVYVLGATNQESGPSVNFYTAQIYQAEQMETPAARIPYGRFNGSVNMVPTILCAGDLLLYTDNHNFYGEGSAKAVNISTGKLSYFSDDFDDSQTYLQVDGEMVRWWWGEAEKFVLPSGTWESIHIVADNLDMDTVYCTYRNQMFYTAEDGIYRLEAAGTNRLKGVLFLPWEDLSAQDGKSMGEIGQMLFDDSGDLLFTDLTHQAVRRINL